MQDGLSEFAGQAAEAVSVLKSIAHEGRLLVLCYLSEAGEMSVGELAERLGLTMARPTSPRSRAASTS